MLNSFDQINIFVSMGILQYDVVSIKAAWVCGENMQNTS